MMTGVFAKVIYLLFYFFLSAQSLTINHQSEQSLFVVLAKGLIDVTPKLTEKSFGCRGRSTRQNVLQIQNLFSQNIILRERGAYFTEGSIKNPQQDLSESQDNQPGRYEVSFNHSTVWTFINDGQLSSTSGLMVWEIKDKKGYGVVFFFENPRVNWNFMGVCIQKIDDLPMSGQSIQSQILQQLFKQLQAGKNWGDNCVLIDNRQTKQLPFFRQASLVTYGYSISILGKYVSQQNQSFSPNCYFQYLIAGIGKQ